MNLTNGKTSLFGISSGAARPGGISQAIARRIACAGGHLTVIDRDPRVNEFVESLNRSPAVLQSGGVVQAIVGDLGDPETAAIVVDEHMSSFGQIDFVVNTAGGSGPDVPPTARSAGTADYNQMFRLNFLTAVQLTVAAIPALEKSPGRKNILTFGTVNGTSGWGFALESAYAASKGALEAWTRCLAAELKGAKIQCNHIRPASVINPHSPTWSKRLENSDARMCLKELYGPWGFITAEEIASLVAFILDPESPVFSGQVFAVDCGIGALGTRAVRPDGHWYLPTADSPITSNAGYPLAATADLVRDTIEVL